MKTIFWFRRDLRLKDNPGLAAAAARGTVLPLYIHDEGPHGLGAASELRLHHSLLSLYASLEKKLLCLKGEPLTLLKKLIKENDISAVYWNRLVEPWSIKRDEHIKTALKKEGLEVKSFNGSLLWQPWTILKNDQTPYKVFTPYYKKGCLEAPCPHQPIGSSSLSLLSVSPSPPTLSLKPWHQKMLQHWNISENGAHQTLQSFIKTGLSNYKEGRNFPAKLASSRLSSYLHFGEISPHEVWHTILKQKRSVSQEAFLSELGWREFSYYLLYHFPALPEKNLQPKFDRFPWISNKDHLKKWKKGQTGIPFVDAGMRELWETGYMHNRVRMVVASFLIKNLRLHWHEGRDWFWDCLFDADLASNSASWQWAAGCGADAAPFFRIFNPVTQGQKFDPDGIYTKRFLPELKNLPLSYLFSPWEAPDDILEKSGILLGKTYPNPIVDLKTSREEALQAFQNIS